ncbi:putative leader peptide [Streptomyces sp. NPDC089919]|uniref:putative leader peptide n=1 Tax=Streptomyces sp. NPDC089919 TaxID=3155188 RepID=UPI003427C6F4
MADSFCQDAYQVGGKTRDQGVDTVRTPHHRSHPIAALTSRRHIDLARTSSAICRPS